MSFTGQIVKIEKHKLNTSNESVRTIIKKRNIEKYLSLMSGSGILLNDEIIRLQTSLNTRATWLGVDLDR